MVVRALGPLSVGVNLLATQIIRPNPDSNENHDIDIAGLTQQMDGSWLADGNIFVRDLNCAQGWHLPDKDAATVAGLVLFESRTIPSSDE